MRVLTPRHVMQKANRQLCRQDCVIQTNLSPKCRILSAPHHDMGSVFVFNTYSTSTYSVKLQGDVESVPSMIIVLLNPIAKHYIRPNVSNMPV